MRPVPFAGIAYPVCGLRVGEVEWVPAFGYGGYLIDHEAHRMRLAMRDPLPGLRVLGVVGDHTEGVVDGLAA